MLPYFSQCLISKQIHTNECTNEVQTKEGIVMGRTKSGNANAQRNNNAKQKHNTEFASEFKANQAQKAKAAKKANGAHAEEFASEFNVQQNQNNSSNQKLEVSKNAKKNQYNQEFGSYAEVESAKMNNKVQKKASKKNNH